MGIMKRLSNFWVLLVIAKCCPALYYSDDEHPGCSISYRGHESMEKEWLPEKRGDNMEGWTSGGRFLLAKTSFDALQLRLVGNCKNIVMKYSVRLENGGWQRLSKSGGITGNPGSGDRITSIRICLRGAEHRLKIQYRTYHLNNDTHWGPWKENGDVSQASSSSQQVSQKHSPLKGIQIIVGPKVNSPDCGSGRRNYMTPPLDYENSVLHSEGLPVVRIAGGVEAPSGSIPWQVAIGNVSGPAICGGTLISNQLVLTAAHCFYGLTDFSNFTVRLGAWDISEDSKLGPFVMEVVGIKSVTLHESYAPGVTREGNLTTSELFDIALLKLSSRIDFKDHIKPACLPRPPVNFDNKTGQISGWGKRKNADISQPHILRKGKVTIFSREDCARKLKEASKGYLYIPQTQMCAGDWDGKIDSCQGDSGGPLTLSGDEVDNRVSVVGIVSYGIGNTCGGKTPGIYTRVSEFIEWILLNTV